MIQSLEESEIDEAIHSGPMVIDFWMDDCPPCNMMDPKLRAMSEDFEDVPVRRVKVDEGDVLLQRFSIEAMPAVLFFRDGELVDRVEGMAHSKKLDAAFRAVSDVNTSEK